MDIRTSSKSPLFSRLYRHVHAPPPRRCIAVGGVVFYVNYLKFFERARTEWLRALGLQQQALREATGAIFTASDTALSYRAPERLNDLLTITVQPTDTGRVSMSLEQQAWRDGPTGPALLCEGHVRVGCVDAATFRPRRFAPQITDCLPPSGFTPATAP